MKENEQTKEQLTKDVDQDKDKINGGCGVDDGNDGDEIDVEDCYGSSAHGPPRKGWRTTKTQSKTQNKRKTPTSKAKHDEAAASVVASPVADVQIIE